MLILIAVFIEAVELSVEVESGLAGIWPSYNLGPFDLAACCNNGSSVYSDGHNNASGNHHNPNTGDFDHGSDNHRCDNNVDTLTRRINHHRCHHHDSTQLRHGPQHDDYA